MVVKTTLKLHACKENSVCVPREMAHFETQHHAEFKRRYAELTKAQPKWRGPTAKILLLTTTILLCVLNLFQCTTASFKILGASSVVMSRGSSFTTFFERIGDATLDLVDTAVLEPTLNTVERLQTNLRGHRHVTPANHIPMKVHAPAVPQSKRPPPKLVTLDDIKVVEFKPRKQQQRDIESVRVPPTKARVPKITSDKQTIPIYYVNLDQSTERRKYMEKHLSAMGLQAQRVSAQSNRDNVLINVISTQSTLAPNDKEIACIASHLVALHKAINEQGAFSASPYAIILEDDVHFEFDLNLNELAYNAPDDFDVLQIMTSNDEQLTKMSQGYDETLKAMIGIKTKRAEAAAMPGVGGPAADAQPEYLDEFKHKLLWHPREQGSFLWSTQAYVVRKDGIREVINDMVKLNAETGQYSITIKNTPRQLRSCKPNAGACKILYPFRLVADVYLYDLFGTAYASKLPFLNGGNAEGYKSNIQSEEKEKATSESFKKIGEIVEKVRKEPDLLPSALLLGKRK